MLVLGVECIKSCDELKKTGEFSMYLITKRGMVALEAIKKIAGTEPKLPEIRLEF